MTHDKDVCVQRKPLMTHL